MIAMDEWDYDVPVPPRYALISVTNKTDIEKFEKLTRRRWTILSTGGTAEHLKKAKIPVTLVEQYTGLPEMMDGRLKTLHPKVHGGLLGNLTIKHHVDAMLEYDMVPIDLLVVNLYDFSNDNCIEKIDIGGPAMIRSGAKNFERVTVVTDPVDYDEVIGQITRSGTTSWKLRKSLAAKALCLTAGYDAKISAWMFAQEEPEKSRLHVG